MSQALASDPQKDVTRALQGRILQVALPGSMLLGLALTVMAELERAPTPVQVAGFALAALPLAEWLLLRWRYRLGLWMATVHFLALGLLAPHLLNSPLGICLLPLAIIAGTLLLGPALGTAHTVLVSIVILLNSQQLEAMTNLAQIALLAAVWGAHALVWAALGAVSQVVEWWFSSYERMRELLDAARTQRVELKQAQEDLLLANQELARLSERLWSMREMAEEARRTKEQFVANVSHELRTPLNIIIGFTEMMARTPHIYGRDLPPRLLADVDVILSSSQHLASLVDDVLDLSQVEAGRMALSREWVAIEEIVRAAASAITPLLETKGLYLKVDIAPQVTKLFCDRTRIRQVLLNLLSNAARYTEQGGITIEVSLQEKQVVFAVTDTGSGIPLEGQQRIFEPFIQGDSSIRRRYAGTGLGLALSKRFVELHGGKMWLESEVGKGATFTFSIPLEQETAKPASALRWVNPHQPYEPRTRPSKAPHPRLAPRYVVVEPTGALAKILHRYRDAIEVVSVRDIHTAVAEVARRPAQALVVNDPACLQQLPSRPELLAELPYGVPVVGCWLPDNNEAAERLGVVQYLLKPITRSHLLAALDSLNVPVKTVLIADDEPESLQLFGRMLSSARRGYRILRATNGQQALTLLRRHPDVMLLDLIMPGIDGYAVLREKSLDPEIRGIPVIVISAQDPLQGPVTSNLLTIAKSGGLGLWDLVNTIEAVSAVLAPPDRLDHPTPGETPAE